jgi:N-acetylmuramoyl-L-alanine amidase
MRWTRFAAFLFAAAATSAGAGAQQSPAPHFRVVLDAAHGGPESGTRISDRMLEKDLVLSLSVRLRSTLAAHGIDVVTTRESDAALSLAERAAAANHAPASACLLLHATASGTGVHLYTSSLAPTVVQAGLHPWSAAQSPYITQSLRLSSEISSAMGHSAIPVALGRTSLAPMDSLACPAVAVEVAPLAEHRGERGLLLSDPVYQARLVDALTGAIEQWRADWTDTTGQR